LAQNYPNPFNPSTTIRFQLERGGPVSLRVIDVRGRIVRTLVDDSRDAGWYQVRWNGTDDAGRAVASGLYFYRLRAGSFEDQKKLLLVK
jgi:flagellar hook assembly protein FlgD